MYENHVTEEKSNYGKLTLKRLLLVLDSLNYPEHHKERILKTLANVLPLLVTIDNLPDVAFIIISSMSEKGRLREQEEKVVLDANESKDKDTMNSEYNKNINYILQLTHEFELLSKNNEESNHYKYILRKLKKHLLSWMEKQENTFHS